MRYKIPIFLIVIMTLIAMTTGGITLWRMYDTALKEATEYLVMSARSQAKLFETMYEEDRKYFLQHGEKEQDAFEHLLLSMKKAHHSYQGYGETGEFVLGKREGSQIVFLLEHRHGGLARTKPIAWNSPLAEPMRRALSGETGTVIAPDYRGEEVLAAYEPLQAGEPLGIVAKIDLVEIRAPFIHTAMIAVGITLFLVVVGSLLFFRVTNPLLRRLAASENRHRNLLAAIPEIVAETDTSKRYIWLNKRGHEFFGEGALGQEAAEYFVGEQRTYDIIRPLFEGSEEIIYVESLQRRSDGKARLLAWYSKALRDEKKHLTGILSTARDITDVRMTSLLNKVILESAGEGILGLDTEGNHLFVNPAAARMLGYTPEEMIGKPSHAMWHHTKEDGSLFPEEECPITGVLQNGTVHTRNEDIFWRKDSSSFPTRYISTPISEEGKVTGAVVVFEDITQEIADRKQLERLNRILRMLSLGNQILVRSDDETELLEALCKLFTDTGLYPVAWIIVAAEDASRHPNTVTSSGIDDSTLSTLLEEDKNALMMTEVLKTQKTKIFNDTNSPDLPKPCRNTGTKLGIGSLGAFPFTIDSDRRGALVICSGKTNAFGDKEIELIEELSGDLAYGLGSLKNREEREKSQVEAQRFRDLVDQSNDAIFLIKPDSGRFFDVNDRACEQHGYTREELLGMHVFELETTLPDITVWNTNLLEIRKKTSILFEGIHRKKDGTMFPVEMSLRYVRCREQDYIVAIARDITERRQNEERLTLFRTLLDNSNDAIEILDPETLRYLDVNETNCRTLGYSREELLAMTVYDIDPQFTPEAARMLQERIREPKSGINFEGVHRRKDGSTFPVEISATMIELDKPYVLSIARDITERKAAEAALQKAMKEREEVEFIINHSPAVAFLWRATEGWPVEYVSESILQFGYSPEDFYSGRIPYESIIHPDDLERVGNEVAAFSEGGKIQFAQEYRILSPEGQVFTIDDRTWVRRDDNGKITHYQGIILDISDRRETEAALEASELRFKAIFDNADDGIVLADIETKKFISVNPRICQMLDYTPEELTSLGVTDIHPQKDLPHILEQFERQARHEIELATDLPVRRKNGSIFYADVNSFPLEFKGKTYLAGFFRDVTERKKSEAMLHRFREVIDHSLDAIFLIDKNGWFIDVNEEACRSLGYSRDKLLEKGVLDIATDRPGEPPLAERIPMIMQKGSARFESCHIRKDGSEFPVEISVGVEKSEGGAMMIAVARDITERKKMEENLRQKEEMMLAQSRQAAMGDMIAMIAHQWRQPITVIAMAANNIKLDIELEEPITNETLLKMTDTVTQQTKHLSKTIDDFRNFFRPNKEKQLTTISEVMESTIQIIGKSLENNNIDVAVEARSDTQLLTYPNELLQVFLNLFSNAKDVLKDREDARITVMIDESDKAVVTTICDNGGGIPENVFKRIGEPYFTTKSKSGTGLGLYMSKTIVEQHLGGTLTWENRDHGACFTVTLNKE